MSKLQNNPTIKLNCLSKLTKIPVSTVFRIEKRVFNKKKPIIIQKIIPNFDFLNIQILNVIIVLDTKDEYLYLFDFFKKFHYLYEISRIYGKDNGLSIQLWIPNGELFIYEELFHSMKLKRIIHDYILIKTRDQFILTNPILDNYDHANKSWFFEKIEWINKFDDLENDTNINNYEKKDLNPLDIIDLIILNEISRNPRMKIITLEKKLTEMGYRANYYRRYKKVFKYYIDKIFFDFSYENIDEIGRYYISGIGDFKTINQIKQYLRKAKFPFHSKFYFDNYSIFWDIYIPHHCLLKLINDIGLKLVNFSVFIVDKLFRKKSMKFEDNFDKKKKCWKKTIIPDMNFIPNIH